MAPKNNVKGMQDEIEKMTDDRNVVVKFILSLRFVLSALMILMYSSGIVTWKVSSEVAKDAVNDLSNKLMHEIGKHINTTLSGHLRAAEALTLLNAGLFENGMLDENEVNAFMEVFLTQLDVYRESITTVSMTTKNGLLFGVYTDSLGIHTGFWHSDIAVDTGKVRLLDYNTTVPLPHERNQTIPKLMYVEPDYNSSEEEWYTVCDPSIRNDKSWTSIYTMGSQTPVTMLSESTVAYSKSGDLMGVTTIDMALGFAGELLRNVELPDGYKAFVVDVKDVSKGGVQAVIGTSDDTPLLFCKKLGQAAFPMTVGSDCSGSDNVIEFVSVSDAGVDYIMKTHQFVAESYGAWDHVGDVSSSIDVDGSKHFMSIVTIVRKNLRWSVVILLPESIFLEDINRTGELLIAMYVSVLVVKALLSATVIYFFISPLRRLAIELELLSEFKMDDANVILSNWSEIRTLQLTFLTLLQQMKVIKSYMPQALFVDTDTDAESYSQVQSNSRVSDSSLTFDTRHSSVGNSVQVQHNMGLRKFDFKKSLTVMDIHVRYEIPERDVDKLHAAHCTMLEEISRIAQSYRGTLDQISSDDIHVVWGRDNAVNLNNIAETAIMLRERPLVGNISIGCSVASGVTGSAGGDQIRTVATISRARGQAFVLSRLAAYQNIPCLFTKRLRDQTEMSFVWEANDVFLFEVTRQPEIIYKLISKKVVNQDQEWLYHVELQGDTDQVSSLLVQACVEIRNKQGAEAMETIKRLKTSGPTQDRMQTILHLEAVAHDDCRPVQMKFTRTQRIEWVEEVQPVAQSSGSAGIASSS